MRGQIINGIISQSAVRLGRGATNELEQASGELLEEKKGSFYEFTTTCARIEHQGGGGRHRRRSEFINIRKARQK